MMATERYRFTAHRAGQTVIVTLAGELDMAATFRLEPELERLTRNGDVSALVIDMQDVEFMDSSALGLLLATQQRLRAEGLRFLLANPSGSVRRMLELTGVADTLKVTTWPPDG
jgi:anti-sigma B factor antagonist